VDAAVSAGREYSYWLDVKLVGGDCHIFGPTSAVSAVECPKRVILKQNIPNPFNPSTTVAFELRERAEVRLEIFDLSGRLIVKLIDSEIEEAGSHAITWDGEDSFGESVASGVYFYRLQAGDYSEAKRMVLLR
jgi:hypothetical protein